MSTENKNNKFDYTIVLDGDYLNTSGHEEGTVQADTKAAKEPDEYKDVMDRLYYDYEKMCLRNPIILDKDDMYPHSYHWKMGDRYDPGKKEILEEALRYGIMVADTEAYEKYAAEISQRRFKPDSWD